MNVVHLGKIGFNEALVIQERLASGIAAGTEAETLLLLEHPPVYTIGSGGSAANILDPRIEAVRTNRGGDVTYHGPGQLVGYPLVDLSRRGRDLYRWLRLMEEVLARVAEEWNVATCTIPGATGLWTGRGKLASIGVGVRRWVTMHGFALNVAPDLAAFHRINPCGMERCPMTSLEMETGARIAMKDVLPMVAMHFTEALPELLPVLDFSQE